jgi:hypothetical protein
MKFEALPAHKGDCLLLHFGTTSNPQLAVIDGGPSNTWRPALKPRLEALKSERGLHESDPLPIEWLVVSHIDDDHIKGILELTRELTTAQEQNEPLPYRLSSIWHNSFADLLETKPEQLEASVAAQFGAASTAEIAMDLYPRLTLDAAKVLASIPQGRTLRDDIRKLKLSLNKPFQRVVMLDPSSERKALFGPRGAHGLSVRVLGPLKPQLTELQIKHKKYLQKLKKTPADPESALAAFTDTSATNLSSIVMEVSSGPHKVLFTGDARGDFILEGLKACGLLEADEPYAVDILKVPHHGSDRNMKQEFFECVHATHYVFSGNGQHGNPERQTLQMLFDARRKHPTLSKLRFKVWLTYSVEEIDAEREAEWEKERKKHQKLRSWDAEKDSLSHFFETMRAAGVLFDLVDQAPVQISLAGEG